MYLSTPAVLYCQTIPDDRLLLGLTVLTDDNGPTALSVLIVLTAQQLILILHSLVEY